MIPNQCMLLIYLTYLFIQIRQKLKDNEGIVKIIISFTRCFFFPYFRFDVTETQVMIMALHLFNFLFGSHIWGFQVKLITKYQQYFIDILYRFLMTWLFNQLKRGNNSNFIFSNMKRGNNSNFIFSNMKFKCRVISLFNMAIELKQQHMH